MYLVFLLLIGIILFLLNRYLLSYWKRHGFTQLTPSFIFGNMGKFLSGSSFYETFNEFYYKSKGHKLVGFYTFYKPSLLINSPKMIYDVFIRDFSYFHDHSIEFDLEYDPLSGHLFSLTGQKWRDLRVKLSPAFTSGKLRWMFPVMTQCSDLLVSFIEKNLENNQDEFLINELFKRYNSNVISSVAFGIDNDCINEPNNDFYIYGNKFFAPTIHNFFRDFLFICMPNLMSTLKVKFAPNDVDAFFKNLLREIVDYREKNDFKRNDFMNLLLQLKNQGYVSVDKDILDDDEINQLDTINSEYDKLQKLSFEEIAAQAFVFFLAAFETNSAPMTFVIFELAKNREMQEKVQQEIDQVFGAEGVTYDSLKKLKYLECCLLESLRKYPPVPVLTRMCTKDYKILDSDLVIKKGTDIKIPLMSIQRDPEYFENPLEFRPERFLDSPMGNSKLEEEKCGLFFAPFGDGPRHCIGMRMAKVNAKLILAGLLSKYKFSLVDEKLYHEEIEFDPKSMPLRPKNDIKVKTEMR